MMTIKKTLFSLILVSNMLLPFSSVAQKPIRIAGIDSLYAPVFTATLRAKFEYQPEDEASRFEVRNARFGFSGNVTGMVSYKAQIDLCDEGKIKMLDAYVRIEPVEHGKFTIGQFRVPFTIDAHRAPHTQYFANRSFIAKQVGNTRDVGASAEYSFAKPFPIHLAAGIFNGSGLTNQKDYWTKRINYSAKAQFGFFDGFNFVLSTQSVSPNKKPINLYDVGANYSIGHWFFEAEYLYKHYAHKAFENVHAVDAFVAYRLPLKKAFKAISFLGRYDMMTDHCDGTVDDNDNFILTDSKRHRATGGVTLSFGKKFQSDIRINYEKYFYSDDAIVKPSEKDKLVVEFMVNF